jgi:hypothetical protein
MKDTGLKEVLDQSLDTPEVLYFYNGTVELRYNKKLHAYYHEVDGVKYLVPGASTVVGCIDKPAIAPWAAKMVVECIAEEMGYGITGMAPWEDDKPLCIPDKYNTVRGFLSLLEFAKANFRRIKEDAGDVGHMAHEWLEQAIKARIRGEHYIGLLPNDPRAIRCINAGMDWMEAHNFEPLGSEFKVYSREYGYAGTGDWRGFLTACYNSGCCPSELAGRRLYGLGDFKSSKDIWDEYLAQAASYLAAREEEFPDEKFDCTVLLHLGKHDGEFKTVIRNREQVECDFEGFLGTLQMYHWMKQLDLDRKHEKEVAKAIKKAQKEAIKAAAPKKKKRIRKAVIKDVEESELIPIVMSA